MLTAGAPRSADHDEERMLRVARIVLDRAGRLPLRIGINRGHVFSGDFGPPFRRTYSVKGDAINLAARVMGKAAPAQVLATSEVVARSQTVFRANELPPFLVKGKTLPVRRRRDRRARRPARRRPPDGAARGACRGDGDPARGPRPVAGRARRPGRDRRGRRHRQVPPRHRAADGCRRRPGGLGALRAVRVVDSVLPVPTVAPHRPGRIGGRRRRRPLRSTHRTGGEGRAASLAVGSAAGHPPRHHPPGDAGDRGARRGVPQGSVGGGPDRAPLCAAPDAHRARDRGCGGDGRRLDRPAAPARATASTTGRCSSWSPDATRRTVSCQTPTARSPRYAPHPSTRPQPSRWSRWPSTTTR